MILPWSKKYIKQIEGLKLQLDSQIKTNNELAKENKNLLSKIRMNRYADIREMSGIVNIMGDLIEITCINARIDQVNLEASSFVIQGDFTGYRHVAEEET